MEITSATMAGTEATVDPATAGTTFTVTPTAYLAGTDEEKEIIVVVNAHLETGTVVNYPFTKKFIIDTLEFVINSYESIPTESTVDLNEITLLGTYTENNLDKIEINQSAQVHKTRLYGITSFINESISLNPGQNSFTAIAYDLAGNEGRAEIAIYYDNTNPEINDVSLQITGITRETDGTFIVNVAD